jgi:hypothetical protein
MWSVARRRPRAASTAPANLAHESHAVSNAFKTAVVPRVSVSGADLDSDRSATAIHTDVAKADLFVAFHKSLEPLYGRFRSGFGIEL